MANDEAPKKKAKRPTAEKRMIQNKKLQAQNRVVKSKIRTASRRLGDSLKSKDKEASALELKSVYSLVDKAVKAKIYKANKAKRLKSHYAKSFNTALSA